MSAIRVPELLRHRSRAADTPLERRNPFPGARPYRRDETDYFHGRAAEVGALAALVRAQRFCLLYAPSGAGKSSLINAGLLSRVACHGRDHGGCGGDFDVVGVAKVHPSAVRGPKGWPMKESVPNVYVTAALNSLVGDARSPHTTFAEYFAARPPIEDQFGDPVPRLLVLDQFEEILEPFGRDDWLTCRNDFFRQLDGVLRHDLSVHVLVSIREDHLATVERLTAGMAVPFQARYRLDKLTERSARAAIERPASASRLPVDGDVVSLLVSQLATRRIEEFDAEIPDEFIEPGQLQVVCNRLWAKADADPANNAPDATPTIRMEHVDAAGGVEGSLRKYYDDAVTEVASGHELRRLRRFMERRLISPRGTRQLVPFDPASTHTDKVSNDTLRRLEDEYGLVRRERRGGTLYWELSHDGFVQPIRRANFEAWDRRRTKQAKVIWGALGVIVISVLAWRTVSDQDAATTVLALEQFPVVDQIAGLPVPIAIGRRETGTELVVELVQPAGAAGTFALRRVGGDDVAATARTGDLAAFVIPDSGDYEVVVTDGAGAPAVARGVNVRSGASIIELPAVVGERAASATDTLSAQGLVVTTVRSECSSLPGIDAGETFQIVDVDRTVVSGIDGVLVARTAAGLAPDEPVSVATGTSLAIVASNGEPCVDLPDGFQPGSD